MQHGSHILDKASASTKGSGVPPSRAPTPIEESEAFGILSSLAQRKTGAIPPGLLVRHILAITPGADWAVRRAASRERPYTTLLDSIDPLRGSCDCPDFLRNSLGICKHLVTVLDDLARQPSRFREACEVRRDVPPASAPRLTWHPIRPLAGEGDWLARVQLIDSNGRARGTTGTASRNWFRPGRDGQLTIAATYRDQPRRRLALVNRLIQLAGSNAGRRYGRRSAAEPAVRALLRAEQEQRIGRIYRLGQRRPIDVYNPVTESSIESRIAGLVSDKKALFAGLFDGGSDEIRFDRSGSFLGQLEKIVEPVSVPELPDETEAEDAVANQMEREMDELVSAADEAEDAARAPEPVPASPAGGIGTRDALPSASEVSRLFARLEIRPADKGGIIIETPADAAASLAALFEGMARMLQPAARAGR